MARMTLTQQLELMNRERAALEQCLEEERFRKQQAVLTLDSFREQVREVAVRVARDQRWCDTGLNEVLEELGLEVVPTSFTIEVELIAKQTVTIEIAAEDLDDDQRTVEGAEQYLRENPSIAAEEASDYSWEVNEDELDVKLVTASTES